MVKRHVTGDESRLWAHMMGDVTPIRRRQGRSDRAKAPTVRVIRSISPTLRPTHKRLSALKRELGARSEIGSLSKRNASPIPEVADKNLHQMDRRNALRLRKGQMKIDATLDLHGQSQAIAHSALNRFLAEAVHRGHRCILVITGKGPLLSRDSDKEDQGWDEEAPPEGFRIERRGVLRRMLPRWLSEPQNRARVIAWHPARGRHGGGGAFYVLLRRRRD